MTDEVATLIVQAATRRKKCFARTQRDMHGVPFAYEIGYYRKGKWGARLSTVKFTSRSSMAHALEQFHKVHAPDMAICQTCGQYDDCKCGADNAMFLSELEG